MSVWSIVPWMSAARGPEAHTGPSAPVWCWEPLVVAPVPVSAVPWETRIGVLSTVCTVAKLVPVAGWLVVYVICDVCEWSAVTTTSVSGCWA